jgi:hypothetical protein
MRGRPCFVRRTATGSIKSATGLRRRTCSLLCGSRASIGGSRYLPEPRLCRQRALRELSLRMALGPNGSVSRADSCSRPQRVGGWLDRGNRRRAGVRTGPGQSTLRCPVLSPLWLALSCWYLSSTRLRRWFARSESPGCSLPQSFARSDLRAAPYSCRSARRGSTLAALRAGR